jgi:hypothetical protein
MENALEELESKVRTSKYRMGKTNDVIAKHDKEALVIAKHDKEALVIAKHDKEALVIAKHDKEAHKETTPISYNHIHNGQHFEREHRRGNVC